MFTFKMPTLLKYWMIGNAVVAGGKMVEKAVCGDSEGGDPYLSLGEERYNTIARFVMLDDRRGFMSTLDKWGLDDITLRMKLWKHIHSQFE